MEVPGSRTVGFVCVFKGSIIKLEAEKRKRLLVLVELSGFQHMFLTHD